MKDQFARHPDFMSEVPVTLSARMAHPGTRRHSPLFSLFLLAMATIFVGCTSTADADDPKGAAGAPGDGDGSSSCDPYSCTCGEGRFQSGNSEREARCVGSPLCNEDDECPAARSGTSEPICRSMGDLVINGYRGECALPCETDDECPDGAFCDAFCWFEADEP